MYRIVILAILITLCLPVTPLTARQWTDSSGVFTVEAELVEVSGDSVRLRKPDGQVVTVPLDRLMRRRPRLRPFRRRSDRPPPSPRCRRARTPSGKSSSSRPSSASSARRSNQVLQFLSDQHDVNMQIDRRALDESGIAADTPVTAESRQGELGTTFGAVLDSLDLAWVVKHDVLLVTTKDAAAQDLQPRVYKLQRPLEFDDLIRDLTRNIDPQNWDNVGGPASVTACPPSALVIAQTQANHRQIEKHYGDLMTAVRSPVAGKSPGLVGDSVAAELEKATRLEFVETPLTGRRRIPAGPQHKLEITIDEKSLADVGVGLDVPITTTLKDVRLCSALSLLLAPLDLVWQANQTGIRIMTPEAAESNLQLVFYRVDDLLANGQPDDLIAAITSTIASESWDAVGGAGSIHLGVRGTLDVRQTFAAHRQVAQLLADLREAKQK